MSNASSGDHRTETAQESTTDGTDDELLLEAVAPTYATPIRVAGFWGAIVFPVCYVPVLATGLSTVLDVGLFLGLIAVNLLALYVGHTHRR
ncbi:hypothetical protein [Haloterrigena alkaliphila]|uniref:Uncharacterized protein n=1 Tax=Haloterrigena alkaliphila TaxID=2816475 RepID=A0A8A2VD36_9EURY|nr:hypothetical protein [Haloterrigena alkaliphila]QSW99126.1 hypothetical protein J0X25_17370 [Haloterrigena alkaliphila]